MVSTTMEFSELKRRIRTARPEDEEGLLTEVSEALDQQRRTSADAQGEYQLLWMLLPLARRTGKLPHYHKELDRAIDLAGGRTSEVLALASLRAELETQEGRYADAEQTLRRSLKLASDVDEERKGALLVKLGRVLVHRERYEQAAELFAEVLPIVEDGGHAALAATCRFHLGNIALRQGRFAAASSHHRQALMVRKGLQDSHATCASLSALGAVSLAAGNSPQALEWFRQAEAEARRADLPVDLAYATYGLGRTLARLGDFASAAPKLRTSLEIRERIGDREGQAISQIALAEALLGLGQPRTALDVAQEAAFHLSLLATSGIVGDAEQLLGRIQFAQKKVSEARRHFQSAMVEHDKHHDATSLAFDRSWLLQLAMEWPTQEEIEPLVEKIVGYLETHPYPDLGERLDYRLYAALEALARKGVSSSWIGQRDKYLQRAYRALMRKTGYLDAELRHRFLFQVPINDAILTAATDRGIAEGAAG